MPRADDSGSAAPNVTIELPSEQFQRRERTVKDEFWPKLKRVIRRIPFSEDLVAAYYCALDPETPFRVRAILLGALAYFILPIDAIPDFIPGIGFGDDAAALVIAIKMVADNMKPKHREAARIALGDGGKQAN